MKRLRNGDPLNLYDRASFYGPFEKPEKGYTDYPFKDDGEVGVKEKVLEAF